MAQKIRFAPTPDIGSVELTEDIIQKRAYELFKQHGCLHGHDVEDWLAAVAEVTGKKPSLSMGQKQERLVEPAA